MARYRLTPDAELDLRTIYRWGFQQYGEASSDKYLNGLLEHFDRIAERPKMFQIVDYISTNTRRAVHGKHSIYFEIVDDEDVSILIVGVIGKQDTAHLQ